MKTVKNYFHFREDDVDILRSLYGNLNNMKESPGFVSVLFDKVRKILYNEFFSPSY